MAFDPHVHMEQFRVSSWVRNGSKQGIPEGWLWRASLQTFLKDAEDCCCCVWCRALAANADELSC